MFRRGSAVHGIVLTLIAWCHARPQSAGGIAFHVCTKIGLHADALGTAGIRAKSHAAVPTALSRISCVATQSGRLEEVGLLETIPETNQRNKKSQPVKVLVWAAKYQVTRGVHEDRWLVRRPRIWQQKKLGTLLCYHRNPTTNSWEANTFAQETKLLTETGGSMGRGLFSMRDFPSGGVIGRYVGCCVGSIEAKDDPTLKAYVQEHDMVCEIEGKYIDGASGFAGISNPFGDRTADVSNNLTCTGMMQFANDAKGTVLQNNMHLSPEGIFTAARPIRAGEELLWRYGLNYWGKPSPLDLWLEAQESSRRRRTAAA